MPSGIERISEDGPVVDGKPYEVDCIIYGTGFEAELTPLFRRAGHEIIGRGGVSLAEKWSEGAASLFGMMTRGFPNLFVMPAPGQQAVVTVNYTQLAVLGAEFVGGAVGLLERQDVEVFDVSAAAEEAWTQKIVDSYMDSSAVMSACTPSRINNEGHPEMLNPRNGNYGRGIGRLVRLPRAARTVARGRQPRGAGARGPVGGLVSARQRVAVVTGGGGGIGAAIAEELGRSGWFVVTLDPLVTLDGSERLPEPEETTVGRIVAAGGSAQASAASVTDGGAVRDLFGSWPTSTVGSTPSSMWPASPGRPTSGKVPRKTGWRCSKCTSGATSTCWTPRCHSWPPQGTDVSSGVTSGSGWRAADAGAYSCAKRAVASLTWQLGRAAPPGVTVNAISPIAATRMVAAAARARPGRPGHRGRWGLSLSRRCPAPRTSDRSAPIWSVTDSGGATAGCCSPAVRRWLSSTSPASSRWCAADEVVSLARVLDAVIPRAFATAEADQVSGGGGNPRFGPIFDEPGPADRTSAHVRSCAVVADRPGTGGGADRRVGGPVDLLPPPRHRPQLRGRRRGGELRG